ncbi:MAG: hypothetical protein FWG00_03685 [Coriobacteriia bacterium]|nr:hypothetical protein [Coriobacteriia bacterium]
MLKARNIIFIAVCLTLFCSVFIYKAADRVHILPDSMSGVTRSSLEGRAYQELPKLSRGSFNKGTFQEEFETFMADSFPSKDNALLANAAWQRNMIAAANVPFGFKVYPTFWNSIRLYDPEHKQLFFTPGKATDKQKEIMINLANSITQLSQNHDVRTVIYVPNTSNSCSVNPAVDYVSDPTTMEILDKNFFSQFSHDKIFTMYPRYNTVAERQEHYYQTDFHWNIHGGYAGYVEIIRALGFEPCVPVEALSFEEYGLRGTDSRVGLYFYNDDDYIQDLVFDYPAFSTYLDGEPFDRTPKRDSIFNDQKIATLGYFGPNLSSILTYVQNVYDEKRGNLLICADSFIKNIEPMFVPHYNEVHIIFPVEFSKSIDLDLYIEENNISDVVIVGTPEKFFGSTYATFFSIDE